MFLRMSVITHILAEKRKGLSSMLLIKNAKVLNHNGELTEASILVENDKVKEIAPEIVVGDEVEVVDAKGRFAAPGLVDVHVHLREPGGEHKETIETGTKQQHAADLLQFVQCRIHVEYQILLNI